MEIRPILAQLSRSKTGPLLVAIQVALSLAILANALYIVNMRVASASRPSGVTAEENVGYVFERPIQRLSHNDALARQQQALQALAAIPGVESVAWASQMPMSRSGSNSSVRANPASPHAMAPSSVYSAHIGFVKTLGLRLVEGRDFTEADVVEKDDQKQSWNENFPQHVIVSLPLAKLLFPGATSYVGKSYYFGAEPPNEVRIIGVVEHLQTTGAQSAPSGEYATIVPWRISLPFSRFVVRAQPGQVDRVLKEAEEAVRKLSPTPTRTFTRTVAKDRENRYRNERALAWMLVAVCGLLLLVTASGIVGMTSLRVAQRRKQIGIRRALGARWRDILRYYLTENVLITTFGVAAGVILTLALNQFMVQHLQVGRLPGEYFAYGAVALWLLGLLAVYGPASRAASTAPAIATRTA
ncbi:MAG: ABC transporter permease [Burkholderiales bacterium]|nr:ABC transporter permease [Burkholderiales bacterium]